AGDVDANGAGIDEADSAAGREDPDPGTSRRTADAGPGPSPDAPSHRDGGTSGPPDASRSEYTTSCPPHGAAPCRKPLTCPDPTEIRISCSDRKDPNMDRRKFLSTIGVGAAAAGLAACASDSDDDTDAQGESGGGEGGLITISVNDPSNPYWKTEGDLAAAKAAELGYSATVGADKGDTNEENSLVDTAISNQSVAMIMDPADADGSIGAVKKVLDADIPVFLINAEINESGPAK